jgi:F-type H+-transporting ATPase subunit b
MLIDWFTVAAQAVNFLVLVWLLKRFLYKPILHAMDAREQRITAQLREAETQKAEARKEGEELRAAREQFERIKEARLKEVSEEVSAMRHQLTEEARHETDHLRTTWREALQAEQKTLLKEMARRVQQETFSIASKVLRDLAGKEIEEQIVEVFVRKLRNLNGAEKKSIAALAKSLQSPILVRTAFDLSAPARAEIEKTVNAAFDEDRQIEFEKAGELIGGIELIGEGYKISWSIGDYLSSLEDNIHEMIDQKSTSNESSH